MAITIRPLAPDDTERCVELGVLAFDGQSKDQILERLLDLKPGGVNWQQRKGGQIRHQAQPQKAAEPKDICLVAVNDAGLVVGFATVTADPTTSIGHLHNLAVDPEAHSQGIGRRLIEAANAWMVERGMSVSKIDTLEVNAVGRWLYPSAGFDELVREINYAMPLSPRAQLPPNLAGLEDLVRRLSPPGTAVSWWAEEVGVGVVSSPNATEPWPVASAIKAFMMAALFVEKKQVWDSVPPELQSILDQQQGYDAPVRILLHQSARSHGSYSYSAFRAACCGGVRLLCSCAAYAPAGDVGPEAT
jgi:GNAT superfamily N-acetyltransferase